MVKVRVNTRPSTGREDPMRPTLSDLRRLAPRVTLAALAAGLVVANLPGTAAAGGASPVRAPAAAYDPPTHATSETAVLSGGCFWGLQGVFEHVRGVKSVLAGYAGGAAATADS